MKFKISLFFICVLTGFMFAIQFNTAKEENILTDSRGLWDLREDFLAEKELEASLIQEIRQVEQKIAKYDNDKSVGRGQVLSETIEELKKEAGLTELTGPGFSIVLTPAYEFIVPGQNDEVFISPDVLRKLINELNMYGAKAISISGQRITATTTIREIQGETRVNDYPLRSFPVEIKVIASNSETAKKLYNRMQISTIPDDFFIDNIAVTVTEPEKEVTVPASDRQIKTYFMKTVKEERN